MNKLINWHLWKCGWFVVHNLVSFPLFNISHIPLGLSGKYCRVYPLVSDQDLSHQSHWQVTCYMQQSVSFDRSGEPTGAPISSRIARHNSLPFISVSLQYYDIYFTLTACFSNYRKLTEQPTSVQYVKHSVASVNIYVCKMNINKFQFIFWCFNVTVDEATGSCIYYW